MDLGQTGEYRYYDINESNEAIELSINFRVVHSFSDYIPKNNKCFCYPLNYMLVTNNNGNNNIYKYEDFIYNNEISENPLFKLELALTIGCSGRCIPVGYKNILNNYDESLPLGKFPTCAWASDAFTNWLTENGVNIATSVGLGLVGTAIGVATGGAGLAIAGVSVANSIANVIGQFRKADLLPSIEGGSNTGDITFSTNSNQIVIHHMRAKTEYMRICDDYFTRFGYKINRVKTPNITGRRYWNYVQIGANEKIGYGDVPSNFMETINGACQKGVTIWHNHDNIGNYELNNTII